MTQVLATATGLFRDRDLFIHDGSKLRRFRVSANLQLVAFVMLMALVAWSSYAVARLIAPAHAAVIVTAAGDENYSAKLAELTAETERRVVLIEQRQLALCRTRTSTPRRFAASGSCHLRMPAAAAAARLKAPATPRSRHSSTAGRSSTPCRMA
jgi:hypothetical protein